MSSPSSALFLWMQRSVTLHNHPASEDRESSNHPRPILLICMSFMCSSMPCPQPALQLLLSVFLSADKFKLICFHHSTTFQKDHTSSKATIQSRDKPTTVGFLHSNINKSLCFSMFTHSLLCFYPKVTSRKVASYSNNSNFICSLDLHLLGCTRQKHCQSTPTIMHLPLNKYWVKT